MRIAHVTAALDQGGAENRISGILARLDRGRFQSLVLSLRPAGRCGGRLWELGVPVADLGMGPGLPRPWALPLCSGLVRGFKADLVHAWDPAAGLMALAAARLTGARPVVWTVPEGHAREEEAGPLARLVRRVCALASGRPELVVFSSDSCRRSLLERGYRPRGTLVLPEGCDTDGYRPDAAARDAVRRELKLGPGTVLAGMLAGFETAVDVPNLLVAMRHVQDRVPNAALVLAGEGFGPGNVALSAMLREARMEGRVGLLGVRHHDLAVLSALDVFVQSAAGDVPGGPLQRAMSCGLPCVVSDCGDAAALLGGAGTLVAPRSPAALGKALAEAMGMDETGRMTLAEAARGRAVERFSLASVSEAYATLYETIGRARAL